MLVCLQSKGYVLCDRVYKIFDTDDMKVESILGDNLIKALRTTNLQVYNIVSEDKKSFEIVSNSGILDGALVINNELLLYRTGSLLSAVWFKGTLYKVRWDIAKQIVPIPVDYIKVGNDYVLGLTYGRSSTSIARIMYVTDRFCAGRGLELKDTIKCSLTDAKKKILLGGM